ncbi:hypothetical protein HZS_1070 [Henneguya salminicola]|nr:hypothetical protein HZS_1070 [Henneguya salminicola]
MLLDWGVYITKVDCSDETNDQLCWDYKVASYPTIMMFDCKQNAKENAYIDVTENYKSTLQSLREILAIFLLNQTNCPVKTHSSHVFSPAFLEELLHKGDRSLLLMILIGSSIDLGFLDALSLDFKGCNNIFMSFVDRNENNQELIFGFFPHPAVILIYPHHMMRIISNNLGDYIEIRNKLVLVIRKDQPRLSNSLPPLPSHMQKRLHEKMDTPLLPLGGIHMSDLVSAVSVTLREEIRFNKFDDSNREIIKNWLNIVQKCLYWNTKQNTTLNKLYKLVEFKSTSVSNKDWEKIILTAEALVSFPKSHIYTTCKGSKPQYRGYPCSMWLILHFMVVTCEKTKDQSEHPNSRDVLMMAADYMEQYFKCRSCGTKFSDEYKQKLNQIQSDEDAILFMWHFHNLLNARLRLEESTDPICPKIQFPSEIMCPDCRNLDKSSFGNVITFKPGYGLAEIKWNKPNVLNLLRRQYGSNNINVD